MPNFPIFSKTRKKSSQNTSHPRSEPSSSSGRRQHSVSGATPPSSPEKRSPTKDKDRERDRRPSPSKRSSKQRHHASREHSHPLNLPPEERKRLSQLSAMSDSSHPMDVDREQTASPKAASPSPGPAPPGSFPHTNGVNGTKENAERPPTPPIHRAQTGPSTEDAESHKAAGNKFFKAKEYDKAIAEYTKGAFLRL